MALSAEEVRNKILCEDPEVRKAYEALETEYTALKNTIRCTVIQDMSKAQTAQKAVITRTTAE